MNSRYYNLERGRYLNSDALGGNVGRLLSHNVFAYCSNNSVNNEDPRGYSFLSIVNRINKYVFTAVAAAFTYIVAVTSANINRQIQSIASAINSLSNTISNYKTRTKAKTRDVATTTKKEQLTTKLYRAMDYVEYNRFIKSGGKFFNNTPESPNVMDTKWFATNPANADRWGSVLNPNGHKIIEITIPAPALNGIYYNPYLDGTVPYMNAIILDYRTVK